ncbi:hypothetical protein CHS0354_038915 [Potamilus streckersoni]|uniref:Cadherin domain-containing protein n=1 Tax=Potamilus streckersoni TaxID=2493646 RepID=A0AAE0VNK7_9BIVA|nr:hypothetical protein CHS0354_038915 [Potamilus streckersoni]
MEFRWAAVWIVLISAFSRNDANSNVTKCTAVDFIGQDQPNLYNSSIDTSTGFAYLAADSVYQFPCCGIVKQWQAFIKQNTGTMLFEVWRSTSGTAYKLAGSNEFVASVTDMLITLNVPSGAQMTVYPDDYIGWYTSNREMVAYTEGTGPEADNIKYTNLRPSPTAFTPGMNLDWSSASAYQNRNYGIRATIDANSPPFFTNLNFFMLAQPTWAVGYLVYTVSASDPNPSDTTITQLTITMNTDSYFSFDTTTHEVRVAANLTTLSGNYLLGFKVVDLCEYTASGTLTLSIYNEPPTILNLEATVEVLENQVAELLLYTLSVTDPSDPFTCGVSTTSPSPAPFSVRMKPSLTAYGVYVNNNPGLSVAANANYNVFVACSDGKGTTVEKLVVHIVASNSPVLTNLPNSVTLSTSAQTTDLVFDVDATDADSTVLTYTMTCSPLGCPFKILASSGRIQLTSDLVYQTVGSYDVTVTVSDGYSSRSSSLAVVISGLNTAPVITNLPIVSSLSIQENTNLGTSVYQVTATDNDRDTLFYTMTSVPGSGMGYFQINSANGLITTSTTNAINYETLTATSFTLYIHVSDGTLTTDQTLLVKVNNQNEDLFFSQPVYRIYANEGNAGQQMNPGLSVIDTDVGDSVSYSMNCGSNSGYMTMASSSGLLTYAINYDLDKPGLPTAITCIVTARDSGGLTATATLSVNIAEINDNTPAFLSSSYTFTLYNNVVVGTSIGNVSAVDGDIGTNGQFIYSLDQTTLTTDYFQISQTSLITLKNSLSGVVGDLDFAAKATDTGGRLGFASVRVTVLEPTTTTAATTTIGYKNMFDDKRNIVWFSMVCILALIVLAVTLYVCLNHVRYWPIGFDPFKECAKGFECRKPDCLKSKPRPRFQPKRPKPPPPRWEPSLPPATPVPITIPSEKPQASSDVYDFWKESWNGNL